MINPFIERNGIIYSIERDGQITDELKGLINREQSTNRRYIGFYPDADVQIDD